MPEMVGDFNHGWRLYLFVIAIGFGLTGAAMLFDYVVVSLVVAWNTRKYRQSERQMKSNLLEWSRRQAEQIADEGEALPLPPALREFHSEAELSREEVH